MQLRKQELSMLSNFGLLSHEWPPNASNSANIMHYAHLKFWTNTPCFVQAQRQLEDDSLPGAPVHQFVLEDSAPVSARKLQHNAGLQHDYDWHYTKTQA